MWLDEGSALQAISATLDSVGLLPVLLALVAGVVAVPKGRRWTLASAGLVLAYVAFRYLAVMLWSAYSVEDYAVMLRPEFVLASFLPLAAVLSLISGDRDVPVSNRAGSRSRLLAFGAAFAGAFVLCAGFAWIDVGTPKRGRILVDDAHGVWESGIVERNLTDFGTDSVYNYSALWDWLGGRYKVNLAEQGPIRAEDLEHVDILVLKTPSVAYTLEEVETIHHFLQAGGGLLAIGDHTDVFGSTTVLGDVIEPLGVEIERNVGLLMHKRGVGNYRYFKEPLLANPLTAGLETGLDFMGSAAVRVTEGTADHTLLCLAQSLDPIDYRDGSFFGDRTVSPDDEVRPFDACVAKRVGDGRLVVWGDSTIFSNFAMFEPGKPEVMLSILSYLNRRPTDPPWLKPVMRCMGTLLVGVLLILMWRSEAAMREAIIAGGAIGALAFGAVGKSRMKRSFDPPPLRPDATVVGFDVARSRMELDFPITDDGTVEQSSRSGSFETLYQSVLRIPDCYPKAVADLDHLTDLDVLVVIDPEQDYTPADRKHVLRAVERGMSLVVIVSGTNALAPANSLLADSQMEFVPKLVRSVDLYSATQMPTRFACMDTTLLGPVDAALGLLGWDRGVAPGEPLPIGVAGVLAVRHGTPVWVMGGEAVPLLARKQVGRGTIYAFSGGVAFLSQNMGGSQDILLQGDPQIESYELMGRLIDLARGRNRMLAPSNRSPTTLQEDRHAVAGGLSAEAAVGAQLSRPSGEEGTELLLQSRQALLHAGTLHSRVRALVARYDQAAFITGYSLSGESRSVLRMIVDDGTGELGRLSRPVEIRSSHDQIYWSLPTGPPPVSARRDAGPDPGSFLSVPDSWLDWAWTVETTTESPNAAISRGMKSDALGDLGRKLFTLDASHASFPEEGWTDVGSEGPYLVLRSDGVHSLGGRLIGTAELWLERRSLLLRKMVLTFRARGETAPTAWYNLVALYDDYRRNDDWEFELDAAPIGGYMSRSQLAWLRGRDRSGTSANEGSEQ